MNMAEFVLLKKGLSSTGQLIRSDKIMDFIGTDFDSEWYSSVYHYNDEHFKAFKEKKSVRGITDVKTNKLVFDFDNKEFPEKSQADALELCESLKSNNIKEKDIEVFFSGNKGFHVSVTLNKELTPKQTAIAAKKLAGQLKTWDTSLYDPNQILRVPWTKNQKSGLYKIPLTVKQLNLPIQKIKELAKDIDNVTTQFNWETTDLSEELFKEEVIKSPTLIQPVKIEALTQRPTHWKDYKWALLNAVGLDSSQRHEALMRIAATCKGLGYTEDITRAFCLTFDEKYQAQTKSGPVQDLDNNVLKTVFSDKWSGGQYSYKNDIWLQQYCQKIGMVPEDSTENKNVLSIDEVFNEFTDFAENFEQNIVQTGIKELDDNSLFLTSTHSGILGQPGSGKTSFLIQWLEFQSFKDQHCFFYSLDMAESTIYAKLVQRVTGLPFEAAVKLKKEDPKEFEKAHKLIKERFKNVNFIFTAGTSVDKIKSNILTYEKETGNKVRFLAIDYLECLQGPYSDQTANVGFISQQLKDLARETRVCSVILLQTQKSTGGGDVSEPILSMKKIKGSSIIEQSASVILTLWREGYSPKFQQFDRYMSFAIVKNRFGPLWTNDFGWNGIKGQINGVLGDEERESLKLLREEKKKEKAEVAAEKTDWD